MQRIVAKTFQLLRLGLAGNPEQLLVWLHRLYEGIDMVERPVEPDTQPSEFARTPGLCSCFSMRSAVRFRTAGGILDPPECGS